MKLTRVGQLLGKILRLCKLAFVAHLNPLAQALTYPVACPSLVEMRGKLQSIVQLLQCYLRAAELEMRAAEEPLRADLDVKGLKAQVLERIEVLEGQERERQEILSGLIPAMEARGYDTGTVKAVMGG